MPIASVIQMEHFSFLRCVHCMYGPNFSCLHVSTIIVSLSPPTLTLGFATWHASSSGTVRNLTWAQTLKKKCTFFILLPFLEFSRGWNMEQRARLPSYPSWSPRYVREFSQDLQCCLVELLPTIDSWVSSADCRPD